MSSELSKLLIKKGFPELLSSFDEEALLHEFVKNGCKKGFAKLTVGKLFRHFYSSSHASWTDIVDWQIPLQMRARLESFQLDPALTLIESKQSEDGTCKLLTKTRDGFFIESVLIPGPRRSTLCISSQAGCARNCSFCETSNLGLQRQLVSGEMIDQVRIANGIIFEGPPLQNLVFMGMGEPFDNLDEVLRATRLLTDPRTFAFSPSKVTVSTVGVANKLEEFFKHSNVQLAVSLNAPDNCRRDQIMPINKIFPMEVLRNELLKTLPRGKKILFAYVLFDGLNDKPDDARLLAEFVRPIPCRVNIIPCNPGSNARFSPPKLEMMDAFVKILSNLGITTLVRRTRGRDIEGGCGQLAGDRNRRKND